MHLSGFHVGTACSTSIRFKKRLKRKSEVSVKTIFASITGILFGVRLKAPSLPGTPARLNFVKQSIFLLIQTSIRSLREKNLRYPKGVTINSSRSLFPRDQMVRYRCSLGCLMCSLKRRVIPWFEQILHVFQLAPDLNFR